MSINALVPWYGGNRMLGHHVGDLMRDCEWAGIPFAGGMSEILHLKARTVVANDLHRHVINLATVAASDKLGPKLREDLDNLLFHPAVLEISRDLCKCVERGLEVPPLDWARAYFVCCWQGRSSKAGTKGEFQGQLALRWEAGGGDSAKRYQSAVESLDMWRDAFRRVTFSCLDVFDFLDKCKDRERHGIYADPPFFDKGDQYKHQLAEHRERRRDKHSQLASKLSEFRKARVVCRFFDNELVRELYPPGDWTWIYLAGRNQANGETPEVLIVRN